MEDDDDDKEIVMLEDIGDYKPEARINGDYLSFDEIIKTKSKAICKIKGDGCTGTGFFCEIDNPLDEKKPLKVLLTCYHVLEVKKRIINEIDLEIGNDKKTINIKNREKCFDKELDYICIQILKEDNINDFLKIDENFSREEFGKFRIYTFGCLDGVKFDVGNIIKNQDYLFLHNCNTDPGWSGGPIFNHENYKVIGLHIGYNDKIKKNVGTFIKSIYNNIKKNENMFDNLNNEEHSEKHIIFYIYKIMDFCKNNKKIIIGSFIGIVIISLVIIIIILANGKSKLEEEHREDKNIINENKKKEEENKQKEEEENKKKEEEEKKQKEEEEKKQKEEEEKKKIEEELKKEDYNGEELIWSKEHCEDKDSNIGKFEFKDSSKYRVCVDGANANKGGKGGQQCVEYYFEKGSIIEYKLGGKNSGGKGGTCGCVSNGKGHNGAGLSYAKCSSFYIVAGGGGGDSESGNKGGDSEENGEGKYGGEGATKFRPGKRGDINKATLEQDGNGELGGNARDTDTCRRYCGGGGGHGHYGGGAGDYGKEGEDGGGGGGSNYCQIIPPYKVKCFESYINISHCAGIRIYKKILVK